jgi:hypothetical protein
MVRCLSMLTNLSDAPSRSSSVIDRLAAASKPGSYVIYFYFDFKDERKQALSGLLSSLIIQLAAYSRPCFDILIDARARAQESRDIIPNKSLGNSHVHATDDILFDCLESMLLVSSDIFIILDALDECPEVTREIDTFPFLRKLVGLGVSGLRLLVTSRPERDIRRCMQTLTSHPLDLDKAHEQNGELSRFIYHELSSPDHYQNWPHKIKLQAERVLVEKARGM